jgi:Eukaryotic mitochondrial regulator protein
MPPKPPLSVRGITIPIRSFSTKPRLRANEENTSEELNVSEKWSDRKDVKDMLQWIETEAQSLKRPNPIGGPNYLQRIKRKGRNLGEDNKRSTASVDAENEGGSPLEDTAVTNADSYLRKLNSSSGLRLKRKLRPFDLNPYFVSMPVLSEMLREQIYKYVVDDGHSVKEASEHFLVSNERVGAVVRMKQIERNWVQAVSFCGFHFYQMMILHTNFDKS